MWLRLHIQSDCHTSPVTVIRRETNVILGNTFLLDVPGTPGLGVPPIYSYSETVGYLIVAIVNSA